MVNAKPRHAQAATITLLAMSVGGCAQPRAPMPPPPAPPAPTASQPCPQWTLLPYDLNSNQDSPYLGCTTHWNLRAMLAEPADWDRGRPLGPADGTHAAVAVDAYRQGKTKTGPGAGGFTPGSTAAGSSGASGS